VDQNGRWDTSLPVRGLRFAGGVAKMPEKGARGIHRKEAGKGTQISEEVPRHLEEEDER